MALPLEPLLLAALAALIQVRGEPLGGGSVRGSASVPLERARSGDTPVLTLSSGRGPLRLLLDTGAASSMVTPALVKRLGIGARPLPPGSLELAGGGEGCAGLRPLRTVLPPLALGGSLHLIGVEALVMPVGALPEGVDGVLGAASLRQLPIRIDPMAGRVDLGNAALATATAPGGPPQRLTLRWRRGVPLLELTGTAGGLEALADTGAEGLFLTPALAARLHPVGPSRALRLVGFCGEQPVRSQTFTGLSLSRTTAPAAAARPFEAIITANPIFAQLGIEAIVGQELLRGRIQLWRLELDPPLLELR